MIRPTLIVMVKEPRAGRVKTRLGKDIGLTASAWWFRQGQDKKRHQMCPTLQKRAQFEQGQCPECRHRLRILAQQV